MTDPLAQEAVDAIHDTFGESDPPTRAVHVKGAWARGTITATPEGTARWVRTRWMPDGGAGDGLSDDEAMARDKDYLTAELHERLAAGPAAFTLLARIAQDGDPLTDPTEAWPEEREAVAAGRLELT